MQKTKSYRNLILCCCIAGIAMLLAFFFLYQTYIRDIIYEERLNQMEEITHQMFQNPETVNTKLRQVKQVNAHITKPIDIKTILAVFDQVFGTL